MYNKDIIATLLEYAGYSSQFRLLSLYNVQIIKFTGYIANNRLYGRHLFYNSRYQLDGYINLFKRMGLVHEDYYDEDDGLRYKCEFITINDEETEESRCYTVNYSFALDGIILEYKLYLDDRVTLQYATRYDKYSCITYGREYRAESDIYLFLDSIRDDIIGDRSKDSDED